MTLFPHHHRTPSYLPDDDAGVLSHIVQLASAIDTLGPAAYGLTGDDIALIVARRDAYEAAYLPGKAPGSRTRPLVLVKNQARDEADRVCRMYSQIIKANPDVPNDLRIAAGVHIDKQTRTRRGEPRTFPFVNLQYMTNGVARLNFRDVGLTTGRLPREDGVTHLLLFAEIAPKGELTRSEKALRLFDVVSKNPYLAKFDQAEHGDPLGLGRPMKALFRGQWLTGNSKRGRLGPPLTITVPLNGSVARKLAKRPDAAKEMSDAPALSLAA